MDFPVSNYGHIGYYCTNDPRRYRICNLATQIHSWANHEHAPEIQIDRNDFIQQCYTGNTQPRSVLYRRMREWLGQAAYYEGSTLHRLGPSLCEVYEIRRLCEAVPVLEAKTLERWRSKKRKEEYQLLLTALKAGKCFVQTAEYLLDQVNQLAEAYAHEGRDLAATHALSQLARQTAQHLAAYESSDCQALPALHKELERRRQRALEYSITVQQECLAPLVHGILDALEIRAAAPLCDASRESSFERLLGITLELDKPVQPLGPLQRVQAWAEQQLKDWSWFVWNWSEERLVSMQQELVRLEAYYDVSAQALEVLKQKIEASRIEIAAYADLQSPCNHFYYSLLSELLAKGGGATLAQLEQLVTERCVELCLDDQERTRKRLRAWRFGYTDLLKREIGQLLFFRLGATRFPQQGSLDAYLADLSQDEANPEQLWRMRSVQEQLQALMTELRSAPQLLSEKAVIRWSDLKVSGDCTQLIQRYEDQMKRHDQAALKSLALAESQAGCAEFSFSCGGHQVRVHEAVLGRSRGPKEDYFHGLVAFKTKEYRFPVWQPGPATLHMSPVLLQATAYYLYKGHIPPTVMHVYGSQLRALFAKLLLPPI